MLAQDRFWKKVDIKSESECWNWKGGTGGRGYGHFWLNGRTRIAPRIAYIFTHGVIPDGLYVLHTCDNYLCVNPNHLHVGTAQDNMNDMIKRDRASRSDRLGELNWNHKLTEDQVRNIRQEYQSRHIMLKELAAKYGVTHSLISRVVHHKIWKHVK